MTSDAFNEGYDVGILGGTDLDNPYPIGSDDAMDWYDGFCDGESMQDD